MNIISANQQFQSFEKQLLHQTKLEISGPATTPGGATATNTTLPELPSEVSGESKASDDENEDVKLFNALTTIGTVKRILEQLKTGHLLSWINANPWEKLEAMRQENQTAQPAEPNTPARQPAEISRVLELNYRHQSVSASFAGSVTLSDGSVSEFSFEFAMEETYVSLTASEQIKLTDPLVLSLSGQPFRWSGATTEFDLTNDGNTDQLPLLDRQQFYLGWDKNQDGQINNGFELFGPQSGQGFAELARLDTDQDGFVDADDQSYQQLRLWQPGQSLLTLEQAGIGALSTQSVSTQFGLYDGNTLLARIARSGIFLDQQGRAGLVQQIDVNI